MTSENIDNYNKFNTYLLTFYDFCFDIDPTNMIKDLIKFKIKMAVPKRKHQFREKNEKISSKLSSANAVEDKKSGEYKLSHHVDLKSGFYNGKKILDI